MILIVDVMNVEPQQVTVYSQHTWTVSLSVHCYHLHPPLPFSIN